MQISKFAHDNWQGFSKIRMTIFEDFEYHIKSRFKFWVRFYFLIMINPTTINKRSLDQNFLHQILPIFEIFTPNYSDSELCPSCALAARESNSMPEAARSRLKPARSCSHLPRCVFDVPEPWPHEYSLCPWSFSPSRGDCALPDRVQGCPKIFWMLIVNSSPCPTCFRPWPRLPLLAKVCSCSSEIVWRLFR